MGTEYDMTVVDIKAMKYSLFNPQEKPLYCADCGFNIWFGKNGRRQNFLYQKTDIKFICNHNK